MEVNMRKFGWAIGYGLVLTAFTAFMALDTFVISHEMQTDAGKMNTAMFDNIKSSDSSTASPTQQQGAQEQQETIGGNTHYSQLGLVPLKIKKEPDYQDENITLTLSEFYEYETHIYVADVYLSSAEHLKTAFAYDTYGRNVKAYTSEIARDHGAVFAINGDFYGAQERGYVIRNGIEYRTEPNSDQVLCIYADGHFDVKESYEKTTSELIEEGVWQAFCFGPGLIENGELTVDENDEVDAHMASNPRTAIAHVDGLHYMFIVSDGRTSASAGLSLDQLAAFIQKLGAQTAYNLDGGGSSSMYFQGRVINQPTSSGRTIKEREVSDIVYLS